MKCKLLIICFAVLLCHCKGKTGSEIVDTRYEISPLQYDFLGNVEDVAGFIDSVVIVKL